MSIALTRYCGCLGCHNEATAIITHDTHGRRAVCDEHAVGQVVLEDV
ncbi:MAG: hypothetical protein RI560_07870 [Natronomonas sp.]|nr:hypothetical protein [Natronomonas sp.]MDR9381573.1 hypothetical protein [Natronomonas sp.]MDR9432065.1 hypothetical protein [Natronomonas sp.]